MTSVAAGALTVAIVAVATYFGFTRAIPFRSHYEIDAVFQTSNNIGEGSPVRVAGVDVGEVVGVRPADEGASAAIVRMRIADRGRPVHRDATAKIRPRIFLEGNFFVDLRPGTPSAPRLEDGDTIPVERTSTPVQFDQVLSILNTDTRSALRTALRELGAARRGGAARAFNRSLPDHPGAYRWSAVVAEAIQGQRRGDLAGFLRDMGTVSAALDRDPQALRGLLADFNVTLGALAREDAALRAAVAELPRTLRTGRPALRALNDAFPATRRLAVELLPGVRTSGPTIDALLPLIRQLRGLVSQAELRGLSRDLRAATPSLARLSGDSVPLLREVRAAASCQNEVILPWTRDRVPDPNFPATGPVFQTSVKWLPGIAGESRSFDANAQWFKVLGGGGVETFDLGGGLFGTALAPILGSNPPKPAGRPPLRRDVPCETQQPPDLRTVPGGPPARVETNASSPAARARSARARAVAIETMRAELARRGVDTPVLDRDVTPAEIRRAAARAGTLGQLAGRLGGGG